MWLQLISALNYTSKSSKEDGGEKANNLSPLLAIPTTTFNESTIVDVLTWEKYFVLIKTWH